MNLWYFRVLVPMTIFLFLTFFASLAYSGQQKYRSPCKIHHPGDSRVEFECKRLRAGENFEKLFGDRWKDVLRFNRVDRRHVYQGIFLKIPKNLKDIEGFTSMPLDYPPGPVSFIRASFVVSLNPKRHFWSRSKIGYRIISGFSI